MCPFRKSTACSTATGPAKTTLVEHGFRLPCALDNRPLRFAEFESMLDSVVYVSATPADYELEKSGGVIVEQVIQANRPRRSAH